MSCTLHSAKIYQVEYSDDSWFNWDIEEINDLIAAHTDNSWFSDTEYMSGSNSLEVEKDEMQSLIDWLNDPDNEDDYKEENETLSKKYSRTEVAERLSSLLKDSDPKNGYVRLEWF